MRTRISRRDTEPTLLCPVDLVDYAHTQIVAGEEGVSHYWAWIPRVSLRRTLRKLMEWKGSTWPFTGTTGRASSSRETSGAKLEA